MQAKLWEYFTIKNIFPSVIIYFYQLLLIIGKVTDFTYTTMTWNEINTLGDSTKKDRQAEDSRGRMGPRPTLEKQQVHPIYLSYIFAWMTKAKFILNISPRGTWLNANC